MPRLTRRARLRAIASQRSAEIKSSERLLSLERRVSIGIMAMPRDVCQAEGGKILSARGQTPQNLELEDSALLQQPAFSPSNSEFRGAWPRPVQRKTAALARRMMNATVFYWSVLTETPSTRVVPTRRSTAALRFRRVCLRSVLRLGCER